MLAKTSLDANGFKSARASSHCVRFVFEQTIVLGRPSVADYRVVLLVSVLTVKMLEFPVTGKSTAVELCVSPGN